MAVPITRIVDATVDRLGGVLPAQGFGIPAGLHQLAVGEQATRYALYSTLQEMVDAGIPTTSTAHEWATVLTQQTPRPPSWVIGRRGAGVAQQETVTITTAADGVWTLDLAGVPVYSFIAAGTATEIQIAAGLEAQVRADQFSVITVPTTPTVADNFVATARIAGDPFTLTITPAGGGAGTVVNLTLNTAAEDVTTALDAVEDQDNNFFRFTIDTRNNTDLSAAASWAAARRYVKVFHGQTDDPLMVASEAGTSIGSILSALSYGNVAVWYHSSAGTYLDAAVVGRTSAVDLDSGRITYAHLQLIGVPVDNISSGAVTNVTANHGNSYVQVTGAAASTLDGIMVDDEFIDLEDTDSLTKARVQEAMGAAIQLVDVVPFTNAGIASVVGPGKAVMLTLQSPSPGHFSGDVPITATFPDSSQVTPADKANRILRNVVYTATYAGAIHSVTVKISLTI